MTTLGQTLANRENAQKSTGPVTPEGKARVAMNGITHGLTAERAVVKGENVEEFNALKEQYLADLNPLNGEQMELAHRIVVLVWKRRRADRVETGLWNSGGGSDEDMVVMLGTHGKELDRISRHTRQIARELAECRQEYRRLQEEFGRQQVAERKEADRMVEIRAEMTAELAAGTARRRAEREGLPKTECEAIAMQAWNNAYARVLDQARRELKREPAVRWQAGWELWSCLEEEFLVATGQIKAG